MHHSRPAPTIRPATDADRDAVWAVIAPVIAAGETLALPREWGRDAALGYWFMDRHAVFVAASGGAVVGTYYLQANAEGGGGHVANCGYVVGAGGTGRGVASAMCADSLDRARERGFLAMQFNAVVSTNERAVALWTRMGFATVGRAPGAFRHPALGFVDLLVMHRAL